jgi:hypothetical protein
MGSPNLFMGFPKILFEPHISLVEGHKKLREFTIDTGARNMRAEERYARIS